MGGGMTELLLMKNRNPNAFRRVYVYVQPGVPGFEVAKLLQYLELIGVNEPKSLDLPTRKNVAEIVKKAWPRGYQETMDPQ